MTKFLMIGALLLGACTELQEGSDQFHRERLAASERVVCEKTSVGVIIDAYGERLSDWESYCQTMIVDMLEAE